MTELQRTGFFREMPHGEPTDPCLADARNPAPTPHEDRIAAYLDAGHVYIATPGFTRDVFDPGKSIGPAHYLTDGRFLWPGDLAHYVRTYHVRLATPFIEHMLAHGWMVPTSVDLATLKRPSSSAAASSAAPADATDQPKATEPADLGAVFAELVSAARDAFTGAGAERLRTQLGSIGTAASRFVESLAPADDIGRERIAAETEALKKTLEDAGTEAARAAEVLGDDLRRAFEDAGARARTRLSSSLRTFSDWLEKPDEERSAQVQSLVESLGAKLDEALAPLRRAEDAEREQRVRDDARSSITERLRERGIEPPAQDGPDEPDDN